MMVKETTEAGQIGGWTNTRIGIANTGAASIRINSSGTLTQAGSWVTTRMIASRIDASNALVCRNGTLSTIVSASAAVSGAVARILASNGLGATWRVPWFSMGGGMSLVDMAVYDAIIKDFCEEMGVI
jgi:hypothetical protein